MRSDTYHWLCRDIQQLSRELCRGRCMLVLEGGYDLPSLGESVCESFRGLLGLGSGAEQVCRHCWGIGGLPEDGGGALSWLQHLTARAPDTELAMHGQRGR